MEKLPLEIFHRIFDHLDIETLFFSIRPVSRSFQSIVLNYDRLDFHLKLSSKLHFAVLCRFIPPQNIRSLTLYNNEQTPGQISLFLQQVHLRQLTQLHSIDLDGIDEFQLNYLCQRINLNLRSFSIHIKNYDNLRTKTTGHHLSTIVKQGNLQTLHLNIQNIQISEIEWASNCSIQSFTLYEDFTFNNLKKIFSCSPQLHRLTVRGKFPEIKADIIPCLFPQLRSLIIEPVKCTIDELESFLLLTPSLSYLKIITIVDAFDGKRWEDFIQINLPHLDQFEFDIKFKRITKQIREDLELILESYRTSFWIEQNKWFISIKVNEFEFNNFQIYSNSIVRTIYENLNGQNFVLSTSNEIYHNDQITDIILRFPQSLSESTLMSMNIFNYPNLTKLHLHFDRKLSINLKKFFSTRIDLSQLIQVNLESLYFNRENQQVVCDILQILQRSSKLSTLIIQNSPYQYQIYPCFNEIIPNLPAQINHLHIPINDIKQVEMIFERCFHLRVIQFQTRLNYGTDVKQWFEENSIGSIFRKGNQFDIVWIGQIKEQNHLHHKRIKANHDHS